VATAAFDDGRVVELKGSELFYIPAIPHESWVVGEQPFHDLRHTFASHFMMSTGDLPALQKILGHATLACFIHERAPT
jgi:integrase